MRMQKKSEIFFNVWLNFAFIDEINTANEKSALTKLSDSRLAEPYRVCRRVFYLS